MHPPFFRDLYNKFKDLKNLQTSMDKKSELGL